MSLDYKLVVHRDALNALLGCRHAGRLRLMQLLETLVDNPFERGGYELRPPNDRIYQVKVLSPFKVTYWADHASKELRVVDIERVDP